LEHDAIALGHFDQLVELFVGRIRVELEAQANLAIGLSI